MRPAALIRFLHKSQEKRQRSLRRRIKALTASLPPYTPEQLRAAPFRNLKVP